MILKWLERKWVTRMLQGIAIMVASGLFILQVFQHILRYINHEPTISVSLQLPQTLHLPNLLICPHQPFNPIVMKDLGLNIQDPPFDHDPLQYWVNNILAFRGLNNSLVAREVWEIAGFFLGEVVHSLSFGDVSENYTRLTKLSPYWERVSTPLGTCLSLLLPSIATHTVHLPKLTLTLNKYIYHSNCPVSPYKCFPAEAEACNSTCGFEKFIKDEYTSYNILLQKIYPTDFQNRSQQTEENLGYILSKEVWQPARLGISGEPLNVIDFHSTVVDRRPLTCHNSFNESSPLDFSTCIDKIIEEKDGCLPVRPYLNSPLKASCNITVIQNLASNNYIEKQTCKIPFKSKCSQKHWEYEIRHRHNIEAFTSSWYRIHLEIASPKMRIEDEVDMYPMSQLFSDIGGSLGLCLGMSILTILKCIRPNSPALQPNGGQKLNAKHCRYLTYWSIVTILAFTMVAHGVLFLQTYITQPIMTSVTRAVFSVYTKTSDGYNSIHDHVAARLATRALDCQPGPYPPKEQCQLDCIMTLAVKQVSSVAPFVAIQDLPLCPKEPKWTYSSVYVVPSLAYATATDPLLIRQCQQQCADKEATNLSDSHPLSGLTVNHHYYHMNASDLLCGLGGIVGLYAGLFLSSVIPHIIRLIPKTSSTILTFRNLVKITLESLIYVCGTTLAIFLLHRYIFCHPISSSDSGRVLRASDQYMLTLCHWPPFQTALSENSSLPMDEQWRAAVWHQAISRVGISNDHGSIVHNTDDYNITFITTIMNSCDSVTSKVLYNNFVTSLYYWFNYNDFVIFSIHDKNAPPFVSTLYKVNTLEAVTLTVIPTHYTRLYHQENRGYSYDNCLYHCVHNQYSNVLGCRLPFATWQTDLPLCKLDKAHLHPYWPNEPPHQPMINNKDISNCHESCRQHLTKFYLVSAKVGWWIESGVNIIQQSNSYLDIEENDWYEFWHLVNDLGVVAGFTFGTSVLSLLQAGTNFWLHRKQRSSSAPVDQQHRSTAH